MGDVGFYSFGRGKALPAIEGALIVTDSDEIAAALADETQQLPSAPMVHSAGLLARMLVYSVFLNPRFYWVPNSLPFLNLGDTEFDPDFPEGRMPLLVREIIERTFHKLGEFNATRYNHAAALTSALRDCRNFNTPRLGEGCFPNYVRFPVIARDAPTRDRAVSEIRAAGIGATASYPSAVCDIENIGCHMAFDEYHRPGAEDLARRLFTLPTHPYVGGSDLARMIEILRMLDR
jgi:perosamine synthetase